MDLFYRDKSYRVKEKPKEGHRIKDKVRAKDPITEIDLWEVKMIKVLDIRNISSDNILKIEIIMAYL